MSREWKPGDGDVAIISWKSPSGRHGGTALALRCSREYHESHWVTQTFGEKTDECVTGVRPLVVIDPEDREQVRRVASNNALALSEGMTPVDALLFALREFAAPMPQVDEPQNYLAAVEDEKGDVRSEERRVGKERRYWGTWGQ